MTTDANLATRPSQTAPNTRAARLQGAATGDGSAPAANSSTPATPARPLVVRLLTAAAQYACAAVVTMVLIANFYFLWHNGLYQPISYDGGDTMLVQSWCKTVMDHGWYMHNPDLAAPHGQSMEDFPQADGLNYLIVKFFSLFSRHAGLVINLFGLSTYVLTTWSALAVLRHFRVGYPPALAAALLYSMLPYHFARLNGHHFLACYQVVPLSVMLALWLYLGRLRWPTRRAAAEANADAESELIYLRVDRHAVPAALETVANTEVGGSPLLRWAVALAIALMQGSAGIYYAFFAVYFLLIAGMAAALQRRRLQPLLATGLLVVVTLGSFGANLAPSLSYWHEHGKNPAVGQRSPKETEIYGLKLSALLLPVPGHRLKPLADVRERYERETAILSESTWSAQGMAANIGFVGLLCLLLIRRPASRVLEGLSVLNVFGILFATVGGFGMVFSMLITPQIRSQNRVSVYISFFSLCCLALLLEALWTRLATTGRRRLVCSGLLFGFVWLALWDQEPRHYRPDYTRIEKDWASDENFVAAIEAAAPAGTMIWQIPYAQYPEGPLVHQHAAYPALRFYLHSHNLRWSAGAMYGREGAQWQKKTADLPLEDQLRAVTEAGFRGIQVARSGYADHGQEIEQQLRERLHVDPIVSNDKLDSYFPLDAYLAALPQGAQ